MIIVSQDRDLIVNFKNISVIGFAEENVNMICSRTINGDTQFLGKYKTEERVKEVLQKIINAYKGYNDNKVYEMPEE